MDLTGVDMFHSARREQLLMRGKGKGQKQGVSIQASTLLWFRHIDANVFPPVASPTEEG